MAPETIVGRYQVIREIGRGGMGSVWLCRDERLGREVAVKQLGGLPGESSPHVARALREARSSAALHHPHVVAIFDAVEDGERVWLVMEYLPSRNLSQLIAQEGRLAPSRLAALGAQVADGLAAAHERGTVHRDVKPGNILVADGDLAKISDFGIARTLGDEQLTQTGMVMGTPLYFSPQLARGADPVPADDVWALGAALYSAVEGEPPWPPRSNAIAMLTHIASEPPPAPVHAGPLTGVIRRMMDPDPAVRPSMAEVATELRVVAAGGAVDRTTPIPVPEPEPAPALAPTPPPAPVPSRPRRGRALVVALLAALVLAGGVALLLGPLSDDGDDTASSSSPARSPDGSPNRRDSPAEQGSPAEEESPTESDSPTGTPAEEPADDPEQLVTDYYALLPDDTAAAWQLLAPSYQESVGRDSYEGFWATVDSVSVDGTESAGDGVVEVDLTYDGSDSETRRIAVAEEDGQLLIVDDGLATSG